MKKKQFCTIEFIQHSTGKFFFSSKVFLIFTGLQLGPQFGKKEIGPVAMAKLNILLLKKKVQQW